jgi:hypothetical protein
MVMRQGGCRRPHVYYYRDKDQREIGLIIEQDGTLYPVEIKKEIALQVATIPAARYVHGQNASRSLEGLHQNAARFFWQQTHGNVRFQ